MSTPQQRWRIERHDGVADVLRNGRQLQSDLTYERAVQYVRRKAHVPDRVTVLEEDGRNVDITRQI